MSLRGLTLAWTCLAPILAATACAQAPRRPNILLVTIDTLRADRVGCYGYARPTTPAIDRLAAEGALFERAFTTLPRTTQSLATLMTGRYPKSHGARGLFSTLSTANLTLAEILSREGYATAAFTSNVFLRPGRGFEQGFDVYDDPPPRWDADSAEAVTASALDWLRRRDARRPFFLWAHYLDPHWTYRPGAPYDARFDPEFAGPFTLYDDLDAGRVTKGAVIFRNTLPPRQVEHVRALYDGEIARVDAALGPLLDAARAQAPLLVILTADHGESLGEQGYYFAHGEYLVQATLRVPLIVVDPGRIAAGTRVDALVENVDIAPTLLALTGVHGMQGVDGRPLFAPPVATAGMAGAGAAWTALRGRDRVFAESDYQLIHPENPRRFLPGPAGRWSSVFDGRFKLVQIPRRGGEIVEMYDLAADPEEARPLAPDKVPAGIRDDLLRELRRYIDFEGAAPGTEREPDAEELQRLKSLGYVN